VATSITFTVGPGSASSVSAASPPVAAEVTAGAPVTITWRAFDPVGIPVRTFAAPGEIELQRPAGDGASAGWVNASGFGPLPSAIPGWFSVPVAAWVGGALNVSVAARASGPVRVVLELADRISTANGSVAIDVAADVDHLRLYDPRVSNADGTNDTLWQVTDRFGNPVPGAAVVTTTSFGGRTVATVSTAVEGPGGGTVVWVNYTVPSGASGSVAITDAAGQALVPTLVVLPPANPWASATSALPLVAFAAVALVLAALGLRARRRAPAPAFDDGEELQRLAEGRAAVVEVVRRDGPIDLAGIATVWDPGPPPPDLADWVASLLTDGTIDAKFGDDGVARFVLAEPLSPATHVTIDVDAFDRGQDARDAARAEWDSEDGA
jgi:hypothetical protein